jgi:putative NADH-flavin reductase
MKIIVFGANGPTGRKLTCQALAAGHDVTAFTRHPDDLPITHPQLGVAPGDVLDPDAVATAVPGHDAVLSVLGVPFSRQPVSVYSVGGRHIVDAMRRHGVSRFACVTSSVMERGARVGGLVFDRVVQPFVVNTIGRTVYDDMHRLEDLVVESGLAWTIVRPSGLFETGQVTAYAVGERHLPERFTSRADLADCLLRQATDETWIRRMVAVGTTAVRPSMVQLIWREGLRKSA